MLYRILEKHKTIVLLSIAMYLQYAHKHLKYFAQCAKCIPYRKETLEDVF